jgi:methionine-rich copper-binding protein CopC
MKSILKLIAGLVLLGSFAVASPALAHSDEVETQPSAGETVEAGIIDLKLTFVEDLLELGENEGSELLVTNQNGAPALFTCPVAAKNVLSAKTAIAEPGEYTVIWRTVSMDGHPVEGTYSFTVTNGNGFMIDPNAIQQCEYNSLIAPPPASQSDTNGSDPDQSVFWMIGLGIFGGGAIVALVIYLIAKNRSDN